ncbi:hypothetical protein KVT40_006090 [Elsinoe batatas]|uniref:Uncharacterized protein n=1 Tax=Elsinoe batatas TaxID=2601811 RepID=A0A8K0KZL0_9PEZI|nr:hypothetical protein KVT40_006090 [Elsinoe batatas]
MRASQVILALSAIGAAEAIALEPRQTSDCNTKRIAVLQSNLKNPLLFCKWWKGAKSDKSPFAALNKTQLDNACQCLIATPSLAKSTKPSVQPSNPQVNGLAELQSSITAPLPFCKVWTKLSVKKTTPFKKLSIAGVNRVCNAIIKNPKLIAPKSSSIITSPTSSPTSSLVMAPPSFSLPSFQTPNTSVLSEPASSSVAASRYSSSSSSQAPSTTSPAVQASSLSQTTASDTATSLSSTFESISSTVAIVIGPSLTSGTSSPSSSSTIFISSTSSSSPSTKLAAATPIAKGDSLRGQVLSGRPTGSSTSSSPSSIKPAAATTIAKGASLRGQVIGERPTGSSTSRAAGSAATATDRTSLTTTTTASTTSLSSVQESYPSLSSGFGSESEQISSLSLSASSISNSPTTTSLRLSSTSDILASFSLSSEIPDMSSTSGMATTTTGMITTTTRETTSASPSPTPNADPIIAPQILTDPLFSYKVRTYSNQNEQFPDGVYWTRQGGMIRYQPRNFSQPLRAAYINLYGSYSSSMSTNFNLSIGGYDQAFYLISIYFDGYCDAVEGCLLGGNFSGDQPGLGSFDDPFRGGGRSSSTPVLTGWPRLKRAIVSARKNDSNAYLTFKIVYKSRTGCVSG